MEKYKENNERDKLLAKIFKEVEMFKRKGLKKRDESGGESSKSGKAK